MNTTPHHPAAWLLALLLLAVSASATAQAAREHGAHEHGHGVLEVAWQGHDLHVALRVPAVNVVGFEHEASTDAQRDAIERALATFRRGQDLIVPSAAAHCTLQSAEVALGNQPAHEHDKGHGKSAGHAHDKEHGKSGHAHKAEAASGETHSELHAEWHFHCAAPQALQRLEVKVFEHLLEVDEIDAQAVTDTLQKRADLRPGSATLDLSTR